MSDRMVLVKWVDSSGHGRWISRDEALREKIAECETIGWLIVDDEEKVIIFQTRDSINETLNGSMSIPRQAILSITDLRRK